MSNKITLEVEIVDTGKIKVKQFADESKKAFDDVAGSAKDLISASANLQARYEKLNSTVGTSKALEELGRAIKKAESSTNDLLSAIFALHTESSILDPILRGLAAALASYLGKWFLENIKLYIKSTSQFEEEIKKLQERLSALHTPVRVLDFLREQQSLAEQQAEQLRSTIELLDRLTKTREALLESVGNRPLLLPGEVRKRMYEWGLEIERLAEEADRLSQSLMAKTMIIMEAAEKYDEMTVETRELLEEFEELRKKYEELMNKFKNTEVLRQQNRLFEERMSVEEKAIQAIYGELEVASELERLEKERINTLNLQIQAEDAATQAIYDGGQALEELQSQYEANLTRMNDFRKLTGDINQDAELFMNLQGDIVEWFKKQGEAISQVNEKQEKWNKTNLQSVNVFASMFDLLGGLSNLMTQFGISIGGGVQRFLGSISAIRQLTQSIGQIRQAGAGGILEFLGLRGPGQGGAAAPPGGISGFFSSLLPGLMGGSIGGLLSRSLFSNLSAPARTGLGAGMGALGGGLASWMLGGSFFGPIGMGIGALLGGIMSLFGGRQRPSERLVASQQGGSFMELFRDRMYGPAASQLRTFLGYENFGEPESRLYAPGLRERGEAFAGTLAAGRVDRSGAQAYVAELRALSGRLRSADIEMSENTIKLVNTITDMAEQVGETIGESQQQLEGVMQNLIALERQITGAILQMRPPTIGARIGAFGSTMDALRAAWGNPDLQPAERERLLRRAFEETTQSAGDLVAELQNMARENQVAARTIEGLSRDIYNLRREEEERRRGVGRAIFEAGLVGRQTPDEANRLRRQYLMEEALRIRTVLDSGQVTGAERIQTAEQGQSIAEEILRLYGQDELVSLEELANVQRDVITALQFIDQQIATGYQEQVQPLQDQLATQRDILTVNQAMLQANFGVQTAAEAIEAVQNTAVGYLEAIRDRVISFGASIADQLAPLLGTDSPMYREMALQNAFVQVGNSLIQSGFENLRRPTDAIQAEMAALPANIASMIVPLMSGQGIAPQVEAAMAVTPKTAYEMLADIAAGTAPEGFTSSDVLRMLSASGVQILQHGGRVARTGIAVVEEGETVVPAGAPAGGGLAQEINLELHLHQTIDGASEETVIRKVIPIIYRESRDGRDVVHINGVVNV